MRAIWILVVSSLHCATQRRQADTAEVLIVFDADTEIRTTSGKNPLELDRLDRQYLRR